MFKATATATAIALLALPAAAQDAAKGESDFKRCKACHSIIGPEDEVVVKGGKTGPNLYGLIGRSVGSQDFGYGDALKAAGEAGVVWDEASLAAYVTDPGAWLIEVTGDSAAKTKMTFKLKSGGEDMAAYLATLGEAEVADDEVAD